MHALLQKTFDSGIKGDRLLQQRIAAGRIGADAYQIAVDW